jgi:ComF family protein
MRRLARFLDALADLVFPPVCLGCDAPMEPADPVRFVCRPCRARLRPLPHPCCPRCGAADLVTGRTDAICPECERWPADLEAARSACLMEPPADRLVHQLKYRAWPGLAAPLAAVMARTALPPGMSAARIVVPVPTTAQRQRERGYNQAQLLALEYAGLTDRTVIDALVRERGRSTQTTLQPLARAANVAGAFRITAAGVRLRSASVVLVDDVLTTGATAAACALALRGAGVRCAGLITFARALGSRRPT